MKRLTKNILITLTVAFILTGCVNDNFDLNKPLTESVTINGEISAPLFNVKTDMALLLSKISEDTNDLQYIRIDDQNRVCITYNGNLLLSKENFADEIPDVNFNQDQQPVTTPNMADGVIPAGTYTAPSTDFEIYIDKPSADYKILELDKIDFLSTVLTIVPNISGFTFPSGSHNNHLRLTMVLPAAFENMSQGYTYVMDYPAQQTLEIPLNNVRMVKGNAPLPPSPAELLIYHKAIVTLQIISDGTLIANDPRVGLTSKISVNSTYNAYGKFDIRLNSKEHLNFSILDDVFKGTDVVIELSDPSFGLDVSTNVGVPFNMTINELQATREGETNAPVRTLPKAPGTPYQVPAKTSPQQPSHELTQIIDHTLDQNIFGNLSELLDIRPNYFPLDYSVNTDPARTGFITSDFRINVNYRLDIPLSFDRLNITRTDTLKDIFSEDIRKAIPQDDIYDTNASITLLAQNKLPIGISLTATIIGQTPEEGTIIDLGTKLLKGATVLEEVNTPSTSQIVYEIDKHDVKKIPQARHIVLKYQIESAGYESSTKVSIKADDFIQLHTYLTLKGRIKLNI